MPESVINQPVSRTSRIWVWVVIIIAVILVSTAAYIILKEKNILTSSITQSQTPGWNKYENNKYGISFEFPSGWKFEENVNIMGFKSLVILTSPETLVNLRTNGGEGYPQDMVIHYYNTIADETENRAYNLGAKNLEELIQRSRDMNQIGSTIIGGMQATVVSQFVPGGYTILVERNDHIWEISFKTDGKSNLTSIEKQIISSFQFTK